MRLIFNRRVVLILLIFSIAILSSGCFIFRHKTNCPAYLKGGATGMGGTRGKPMGLFPKKMHKKHSHK